MGSIFLENHLIICMRANAVGMIDWANGVSMYREEGVARRGVAWSVSEHMYNLHNNLYYDRVLFDIQHLSSISQIALGYILTYLPHLIHSIVDFFFFFFFFKI